MYLLFLGEEEDELFFLDSIYDFWEFPNKNEIKEWLGSGIHGLHVKIKILLSNWLLVVEYTYLYSQNLSLLVVTK